MESAAVMFGFWTRIIWYPYVCYMESFSFSIEMITGNEQKVSKATEPSSSEPKPLGMRPLLALTFSRGKHFPLPFRSRFTFPERPTRAGKFAFLRAGRTMPWITLIQSGSFPILRSFFPKRKYWQKRKSQARLELLRRGFLSRLRLQARRAPGPRVTWGREGEFIRERILISRIE